MHWKAPIRHLLGKFGWELKRIPDSYFVRQHHVDLVLDVGANEGQYACGLRSHGYTGRIKSFEPVSNVFDRLSQVAANDQLWTVAKTAIGAAPGIAEINVSELSTFSSLKRLSSVGRAAHPQVGVIRTEMVPIAKLDDILDERDHGSTIFLKIDTQGFEKDVLDGASRVLSRAVGVMLELPIDQNYEGVWSLTEALAYLDALGFVPSQFRQVVPVVNDPSSSGEFDCIFRRKTPG
jgi:FkbM family methyltransferase